MRAGVIVSNHGSIWGFQPITKVARDVIRDNVASEGWQWLGSSLCVDSRFGPGLVELLQGHGLEVTEG